MKVESKEAPVSIRLTLAQAKELEHISEITDHSVSEIIREAITSYLLLWRSEDAEEVVQDLG